MYNKLTNIIFFDIETIPDVDVVKHLTACKSLDIEEMRDALKCYHLEITDGKNDFLRQPFHKIVVISCALVKVTMENNYENYEFAKIGSLGKENNFNEAELIQSFIDILNKGDYKLVSFNGRTFDIPVLKYRAMKYGINWKKAYYKDFTYRYNLDNNFDLLELLSDFGASARVKLNEVCSIFGFPGKFGIDGSKVALMFDEGKLKEIRNYCETDVINTYLVYLRYALTAGKTSKENYNKAVKDLIQHLENRKDDHLLNFKNAWLDASNNKVEL